MVKNGTQMMLILEDNNGFSICVNSFYSFESMA